MPCEKPVHLDKRYRERYCMSMVENVKMIKSEGMAEFLKNQAERYSCPSCGKGVVCVHDNKCYSCGYLKKT
jgi:ribosomal protein S27AE